MEQKLYTQMTPDEQLSYVTDLTKFINDKLPVLERIGDAWEQSSRKDMETGLQLLYAFQFARDFVDKAVRYGDYAARAHRLRIYVEKIKGEISKGLALQGSDGHTYALVAPSVPARRRGRPSAAEVEARKNGIEMQRPTDPEMEKQMVIARLMGIDVIVSDKAPREKNNAEVAAEKAAKKAEYDRQNPSLFGESGGTGSDSAGSGTSAADTDGTKVPDPSVSQSGLPCPTMSEVYQDRIEQDRLRLSDLAWLCSDDLKKRIEMVRGLRVTAESASERAKTMGDMGAAPEEIEPYAQQAKEAVEGYLAIYAAVDEELATVFYRLQNDEPYRDKFLRRFKGVDLVKVSHICRPYYEKLRSPELDMRIKAIIEQENPEYAAKMKAEEAKKEEISDILRYLKRKDKPASDARLKTAKEVKYPRLVELIGEEEAKNYYPYVQYIEEENAAIKRAKSDAGIDSSEREQGQPKVNSKLNAAKKAQPKATSKQSQRASVKK
jgi:hypothetical protein